MNKAEYKNGRTENSRKAIPATAEVISGLHHHPNVSRRRFYLQNENLLYLEKLSKEEDLSCSAFLDELLEKMRNSPAPVAGWLSERWLSENSR